MATNKEAKVKFTAETSEFTQGIKDINKSLGNLKSDLKLVNTEIKANGGNYENLSSKQKTLKGIVDDLSSKLELQGNKLEAAKRLFGENSDEVDRLYRGYNTIQGELVKFTRELKDTETALEKMGDGAEETSRDIDELDGELEEVEGGSEGLKGVLEGLKGSFEGGSVGAVALGTALADLAKNAVSFCIEKIKELAQYIWDLPEATREFESNMAKLSGSTKQYGYDTDDTKEKVKELYGYFEDEQVAVNAITNLQGMKLSQDDLNAATDAAIAVWTAYGDSIPIESLTESINETSQVSKVTGSLADALNWAGVSEDEFNEKLAKLSSTEERAQFITDTLNGLYGESKTAYDEATEGSRDLAEAQFDLKEKEDALSDAVEPAKTAFENLKSQALEALLPVVEKVADWIEKLVNWFNNLPGPVKDAIAIFAAVTAGVAALAVAVGVLAAAWWLLNSALAPIIAIVLAVIAVITAIILIIKNWGEITDWLKEKWNQFKEWIADLWDKIKEKCSEAWESIKQTISDAWDKVKEAVANKVEEVKTKISDAWQNIKDKVKEVWDNIVDKISEVWETIKNVVEFGVLFIKELISACVQIILIPWRTLWENVKEYVIPIWEKIKETIKNAIEKVKSTLETAWNKIKTTVTNVWNTIKDTISKVWNNIKSSIETTINNIKSKIETVFNNVKTTVTNIFNNVKSAVTTAWNNIKSAIETVVNNIKSKIETVFNNVKSTVTNIFNNVKSTVTNVWNGIKSAISSAVDNVKSKVTSVFNSVKSAISTPLNAAKSTVSSIFNGIKSTISNAMNSAKNTVSNAINKIKGLFKFNLSFPKIKLPHIKISGKFSLNPPSVPKFSVSYYKDGGIMMNPTMFGINGSKLMVGGEAGAEAILPLDSFYDHLDRKLESVTNNMNNNVTINLNDVHLHNNLDVETLTEQIAFTLQRKTKFQ